MRLRVANCKSCGAAVRLQDDAESVTCASCGSIMSRDDVIRGSSKGIRKYPNLTPIKLGMKGLFHGREFEVIGRVVLSMREEGEKYTWTEFQLLSGDGEALYLEIDEGEWKLMEPFVPVTPFDPKAAFVSKGSQIQLEQSRAIVSDVAVATVEAVEGELTYTARVGEKRSYLDARSFGSLYAVEWTDDEIEFYRGKLLSERDVLRAFGLKEQLEALDRKHLVRRSQTAFAAVCLVLGLVSLVFGVGAMGGGTLVSNNSTSVSSVGQVGLRFGPISLNPSKRVHRLTVFGQMRESSAWVSGVLEKGTDLELIGSQGDFWDESGTDDDGYWHESDLTKSTDFIAKSAGPYYVRLYAESDNPGLATSQTAGYEIRAGVVHSTYLFIYGIVSVCLSILFFLLGSREKLKKMAEEAD